MLSEVAVIRKTVTSCWIGVEVARNKDSEQAGESAIETLSFYTAIVGLIWVVGAIRVWGSLLRSQEA